MRGDGMKRIFGAIAVVALVLVAAAPTALAQRSYGTGQNPPPGPPVEGGGPSVEPNVVTPPQVQGETVVAPTPQVKSQVGTLPFTGTDVAALAVAGGVLLVAGAVLVRSGRRARVSTA